MPARPFHWPLIALLASVAALNYCDRTAISAVYPLLRAEFGVSYEWLGGLGSVFLWSYALASPLAGWVADRWSRAGVVLVSLTAWSLVTLLTGLVRTPDQLLATRFLLGLAEAAYLPAAVGLLADSHAPGRRGRAISVHTAGLSIGAVAGGTVAGYLGEDLGWRSPFLLLGVLGLGLAAAAAPVLLRAERPENGGRPAVAAGEAGWGFLRVPGYWALVVQSMAGAIAVWLFLNWLPLYFTESFGLNLGEAGFAGTAIPTAASILGVIAGGALSDRVARRGRTRRMLLQCGCYLAAAPLLALFGLAPTFALAAAAVFGFSVLRSLAAANENPLICDLLPPRQQAKAIGLWNTANCAAGASAVLAAGFLKADYGLGGVFAGAAGLVLLAATVTAVGYAVLLPRSANKLDPGHAPETKP